MLEILDGGIVTYVADSPRQAEKHVSLLIDAQFATVIDDYKAIEDVISQAGLW